MRVPITQYGVREVGVLTGLLAVVLVGGMVGWPGVVWPWGHLALAAILAGGVLFFRDPQRAVPAEQGVLLAPADGTVTDILEVPDAEYLGCKSLRIGIFLSVFDVHINRAPCAGVVEYRQGHPGKCLNALRWRAASKENEAMSVGLRCERHPAEKVLVKQITGAIARRIVCDCTIGQQLDAGDRFGMIKFGSRTELYVQADSGARVMVKLGDGVQAGVTVLVRFENEGAGQPAVIEREDEFLSGEQPTKREL